MKETKRDIDEAKYHEIAKANPNALDVENLKPERILGETPTLDFIFYRSEYPYTEFLGKKVKHHLLFVPTYKAEIGYWIHPSDIKQALQELGEKENENYMVFWKGEKARSIQKWHAHLIVFEDESGTSAKDAQVAKTALH
jgi:hypothetical protein